jgi:polyisoprenoid-binding protein YceI
MKESWLSEFWRYRTTASAAATCLRRTGIIALSTLTLLAGTLLHPLPSRAAPERYQLDANHMAIAFLVSHVGFAKTLGQFTRAEGTFVFDPEKPAVSDIAVTIDAASVDTQHEERDKHLRAQDFLWVEQHPQITFRGTAAEQTAPRTGRITGDLTIRGVTKPVTLDVVWNKSGQYTFGDMHYATGISARTKIKRSDFGMTYALEGGMVGDEIEIILEFEGIRQAT